MAKIISFLNHKGGVGKTTSAINMGAVLAEMGKRVLLIDLDPQASLTLSLGVHNCERTIYTALKETVDSDNGVLPIIPCKTNLSVVPSDRKMADAEYLLLNELGRESFLKELIAPISSNYDYIILDCPPALGLISINALVASDHIIVPVQAEILSLHGLVSIVDVIATVQKKLNKKLAIAGFLMTQYDARTGLHRRIVENMREQYENKVFESVIRRNIRISEAPLEKMDIISYDANCSGANDYIDATKELIQRV
ncbi:MAG: ParA family protein [Bacteroides sp.]|uniref:ParA family protein n=1 Tax=Bacteroides sp. TaxID=29523 RepID=UPI002FC7CDCC